MCVCVCTSVLSHSGCLPSLLLQHWTTILRTPSSWTIPFLLPPPLARPPAHHPIELVADCVSSPPIGRQCYLNGCSMLLFDCLLPVCAPMPSYSLLRMPGGSLPGPAADALDAASLPSKHILMTFVSHISFIIHFHKLIFVAWCETSCKMRIFLCQDFN
jgi:hypothetical protein